MRVLFFVEPFPVRGAPLEFRWVAEQWLGLGVELSRRGITPLFAVSDALKGVLPRSGAPLSCPADLGVSYQAPDSPALVDRDWVRLMTEADDPAWRPFVEKLLEQTRPDVVVTWTINAPLRAATAARRLLLMHQELGLMRAPNPQSYFADPRGLNGASALSEVWPQVREQALTVAQERELDWLASDALARPGQAREASLRSLGLAQDRRTLAIFLQVSRDSNVLMWSRVAGNEGLVNLVLDATRGLNFQVVVKPHPREPELPRACAAAGIRPLPPGTSTETVFDVADAVCTVNSSVGFEALARGKVVYTFGDSPYAGRGCTRDMGGGAEELRRALARETFLLDADEERARRRLVHFMAFRYLVSQAEMFDADAFLSRVARWQRLKAAGEPLAAWFDAEPGGARRRDWTAERQRIDLEERLAQTALDLDLLRRSTPQRFAAQVKRIPGVHAGYRLASKLFGRRS